MLMDNSKKRWNFSPTFLSSIHKRWMENHGAASTIDFHNWTIENVINGDVSDSPSTKYRTNSFVRWTAGIHSIGSVESNRQGNIHNHLADCVKATKISGITYIDVLFRFFGGDFFLIDRKLINYSWLLINSKML